jgi:hypothetical protein
MMTAVVALTDRFPRAAFKMQFLANGVIFAGRCRERKIKVIVIIILLLFLTPRAYIAQA